MSDAEEVVEQLVSGFLKRAEQDMLNALTNTSTSAAETDSVFTMAKLEEAIAKVKALGPPPPVIRESEFLTERHEDWSRVRSAGRAARRLKQGHRQNIDVQQVPMSGGLLLNGVLYVHPLEMLKIKGSAA